VKIMNAVFKIVLPVAALALIAYAALSTMSGRPDDTSLAPAIEPATAPATVASGAPSADPQGRVAGAGVVEPSSELVAIAPFANGVVNSVAVVAGQTVKKGDLLFTLDARELQSQLQTRRSALATQQRNVELARADLADKTALLNLYQRVDDPRATTREELLRRQGAAVMAQAGVNAALAQAEEARAALQQANTQLALSTVRSPLDATVLQVRIRPGEYAAAGRNEALMVLGQTSPLHVRIDVDEADVPRLATGQPASVSARGSAGKRVQAQFVRAEPLLGPKRSLTNAADERVDTRVLQVIYALPANTTGFFVGQQVDAFLTPVPAQ
jgi:HlyD family secretion protein